MAPHLQPQGGFIKSGVAWPETESGGKEGREDGVRVGRQEGTSKLHQHNPGPPTAGPQPLTSGDSQALPLSSPPQLPGSSRSSVETQEGRSRVRTAELKNQSINNQEGDEAGE